MSTVIQRFRKKPVVIEAMQFPTDADGNSTAKAMDVYQWVERNTMGSFEPMAVIEGSEPCPASGVSIDPRDGRMMIATLRGPYRVNPGDYVIRGAPGQFYPCPSGVFEATYDAVPS